MEEWKYWIALKLIDGIGEVGIKNLISRFHSPRTVFESGLNELEKVDGIGRKTAHSIKSFGDWEGVEKEIRDIDRLRLKLIVLTDSYYPKNLFNIYYPPPLIYLKGDLIPGDELAVAIVGSRVNDRYGKIVTEIISTELALRGITIVSGMARGIDSVAHVSALKAGGRTIAILGSGLDVVYPPENKKLYNEISDNGAVISEFSLGLAPDAVNFPKRNRTISGLSLGVIVIQASEKSGSLITASFGLEQNREVFSVPGNITSKLSRGTHMLIKQGAKLVESVDDIMNEIEAFRNLKTNQSSEESVNVFGELSDDERAIYSVLKNDPIHIDEIITMTGINSAKALSILLSLELNGLLTQLPGKMFQLKRF
ncbi:MAG: DNA-processing protein DprA [Thermodesulfobacteriota bacterium]